jgi:hypothetical protein
VAGAIELVRAVLSKKPLPMRGDSGRPRRATIGRAAARVCERLAVGVARGATGENVLAFERPACLRLHSAIAVPVSDVQQRSDLGRALEVEAARRAFDKGREISPRESTSSTLPKLTNFDRAGLTSAASTTNCSRVDRSGLAKLTGLTARQVAAPRSSVQTHHF